MGTVVNVTLSAHNTKLAVQAAEACLRRMAYLESLLSRFQSQSQLCSLNRSGKLISAAPDLVEILTTCKQLFAASGGAFDVTVEPLLRTYRSAQHSNTLPDPTEIRRARSKVDSENLRIEGSDVILAESGMAITLDGIAKGYIIDQGVECLRRHGFDSVLVEAGGDLRASGTREDDAPWKVGLQAPRSRGLLGTMKLDRGAVATSGDYQQWFSEDLKHHHVVDPRKGESSRWLASATVLAPTVMIADAVATTLMVLDEVEGDAFLRALPGAQALRITKQGDAIQSPGLSFCSLYQA
jgi:thiamine biosynthesis lipoprotein